MSVLSFTARVIYSRRENLWCRSITKLCGPTVALDVFEKQKSPASAGNRIYPRCPVTTPTELSRAISIMFGPKKIANRWTKIFSSETKKVSDLILFLYVNQLPLATAHKGPIKAFTVWQKHEHRHWLREELHISCGPTGGLLVAGDGQHIAPTDNNYNHLQPPKTREYLAKHPPALSNITGQCLVKTIEHLNSIDWTVLRTAVFWFHKC